MAAKILVFVCAAFGLAAGCYEFKVPQETQFISVPIQNEGSFCADNLLSSDNSAVVGAPVSGENVFCSSSSSSPVFSVVSAPVVSAPVMSAPAVPTSVTSENSISDILSSMSSGSSYGVEASNGPDSSPITYIQAPAVTLPAVESPVINIASQPIPAPRVISQRCICTKTIVKPQIIQRQVTVPRVQRYLKRTVTPVIENIAYKSTPISQGSSSSGSPIVIPGSAPVPSSSPATPVVVSSEAPASSSAARYITTPVVVSSGSSSARYF